MPRKEKLKKRRKARKANNFHNQTRRDHKRSGRNVDYVICKVIGIPSRFYTQLVVSAMRNITNGYLSQSNYALNSLYNPYQALFTYQPHYHDQLSLIYKFYKVTGCWVSFQIQNQSASQPVRLVMYADSETSAVSSIEEARQKRGSRYMILGRNTNATGLMKFQKYFNFRQIVGEDLDSSAYEALTTADPAYIVYLHLIVVNGDDAATAIDINVHTYFRFYCSYFDRKKVGTS